MGFGRCSAVSEVRIGPARVVGLEAQSLVARCLSVAALATPAPMKSTLCGVS